VLDGLPKGEAAALCTAVSWAGSALLFAAAARRVGANPVNLVRLGMATILLGALVLATGTATLPPAGQIALLALSGVIGLGLGDEAWFRALRILGARRASLFSPVWPVFAALAAWPLLGETLGWWEVGAMAVALAGVRWAQGEAAAEGEVQGSLAAGVLFAVLSCAGQAVGYVVAKPALGGSTEGPLAAWFGIEAASREEIDPLFGTFLRMVAGTCWILVAETVRGRLRETREALGDGRGMLLTLGGAITGPVFGVWMSLVALRYAAHTAIASTILATSPLFVLPLARMVHGTPITRRAILGFLLALAGIVALGSAPGKEGV
jgi:drug/metabolite transporter (DMT)-like permease